MSFKRFDTEDLVVSSEAVASTLWSTNAPILTAFYTSSAQEATSAGDYYTNVYSVPYTGSGTDQTQFSIAFAHKQGSGSLLYNSAVPGKSYSSTVYGQFRTLVLGDEDTDFSFGGVTSEYFYVISIDRNRYKESLIPGTFNLLLSGSAAADKLTLTDNSVATSVAVFNDAGRVYQIISGSNGASYDGGTGYSPASGSYGYFLPDVGLILLNGEALDETNANGGISLSTGLTSNSDGLNERKLYNAIKAGASFQLNSQETVSSQFAFVRVRNSEFNYSTNPSYITGSGDLRITNMVNAPQTYITTVGMYNDNNELLAVAKLSRPLLKDFTKEALVRIKLDF